MGGTPTFCSIAVPQSYCNGVLPRLPSNSHSIRPRRFKILNTQKRLKNTWRLRPAIRGKLQGLQPFQERWQRAENREQNCGQPVFRCRPTMNTDEYLNLRTERENMRQNATKCDHSKVDMAIHTNLAVFKCFCMDFAVKWTLEWKELDQN